MESSITRERDLPTPLNASSTAIAFDIDLIFQRFFSSLFSLPLYHHYYYVLNKKKFHVPGWFSGKLVKSLVGGSMEKCVNLFFRINLGSRSPFCLEIYLFATRNASSIWEMYGEIIVRRRIGYRFCLKIPLIRVISVGVEPVTLVFGPVFTPSIRVGDLRVHDRQSRLSTCDDVSPLSYSRAPRLFSRS